MLIHRQAIGGTIGTGLFVGSGGALARAGPLSLLLGYLAVGTILFSVLQCIGEMATYLPIPGGLTVYAKRYVSDDAAFAMGLNYWFGAAITICAEVSAAAIVITYWTTSVSVGVWITIILAGILALNIFSVKGYGEGEFIFASLKIITIIGLLLFAVIVDLGGSPTHDRIGFRYWKNPGAMKPYLKEGNTGRFLGLLSTLVYAAFAYGGSEVIAVAAAEAEYPRKNIPKACNRVIWRVLLFYVGGILAIGVLVASNDEHLVKAIASGAPGAGRSPFVIAINNAQVKGLPSVINAIILSSAWSAGNAFLYSSSRNLYALALAGQVPAVFAKCNRNGVPWVAVLSSFAIGLLSYLNVSNSSSVAFGWFSNITTISSLFNWWLLTITYVRFRKGAMLQGLYHTVPFKAFKGPYSAWYAIVTISFIILIQGFPIFFFEFKSADFFAAYIGLPIFFVPMLAYKFIKKSKYIPYSQMDFLSGKDEIDEEERLHAPAAPTTFLGKAWAILV